jgi:hypothetical protein
LIAWAFDRAARNPLVFVVLAEFPAFGLDLAATVARLIFARGLSLLALRISRVDDSLHFFFPIAFDLLRVMRAAAFRACARFMCLFEQYCVAGLPVERFRSIKKFSHETRWH